MSAECSICERGVRAGCDCDEDGTLKPWTPLYKYEATVFDHKRGEHRDVVVYARNSAEADDCAAALAREPQRSRPGGPTRLLHHPRQRGGLYEFTWGERLAEAHFRLRNAAAETGKQQRHNQPEEGTR